MDFRLHGLLRRPFDTLFGMPDEELERSGSVRRVAAPGSIFPCRVSLQDAAPGEEVILTNFAHLTAQTSPYRAVGPIFVRRAAAETWDRINEVPAMMVNRHFGLRAYDGDHMLVDAQVTRGSELPKVVGEFFSRDETAYIHAHYAAHGCYVCRIDRA